MKKIILVSSCLLLSLILWMGNSTAKPVDTLTAKTVATHFLAGRNVELPRSAQQARIAYIGHSFDESSQRSVPCYYIVNLNQGFVILSADNRIEPILGYSTEGNFNTEDIPDNMLSFLDGYSAQIKAFLHDTSSTPNEATAKWTSLIRDDYTPNSTKGAIVGPLLTTTWDQNSPYNALCPTDASATSQHLNGHVYAGCVATAMAQVIRYWQYPCDGAGGTKTFTYNNQSYSVNFNIVHYDYSKMPDFITTSSPSNQITEVAKLTYHCGVSAAMEYGITYGSSASLYNACNALNNNFSYNTTSSTMTPENKYRSSFSDNDWINLLKTELNAWRPILYRGQGSSGGHAFVCDGYDDQNYFHFNWGWSGSYNGYFLVSALSTGNGSFNSSQQAIIHIQGNTPMIKTGSPSLSFLCAANTVSESKSLPLHGVALSSNIVITAPANFEVSTDGTTFSTSLNVNNTASSIYVRYAPTASGQTTDHGTLTLTSGTVSKTVALSGHTYALDCNAPQNVQHTADNSGNVQLSWNAPTQDIHTYKFSIDSTNGGIAGLGATRYVLAQRACDSDLVVYHQKRITQVSFYIYPFYPYYSNYPEMDIVTNSSERKIVIYQGGSFVNNALDEGTLIREQTINSFSYGWNTVTLSEPVTIDANQELWYGVHFYTTSSYPIAIGDNPGVAGKGDLVKANGSWTLLSSFDPEYGLNHNIPLKITIQDSPSSIANYTIERNDNIVGTITNTQYNDHVTNSGTYTYNVTANWDNGCSATSNDITINVITDCTTTYGDTNAVACGSFDWYEHTGIQTSGDYTHTFIGGNVVGCDSVVTMHLTVGHSNTGDTTAFACNSFDWYEHHNITSSTSSLTHTFTNASGCDSVVTLHLTVGHSNTGDTTAFACNSFDWYEHHNITSSTSSLTHTFTNASGCDSVVTLHLTVGHSNTGDTTAFACNSFDWYEHHNITSSTSSLKHTFTNASGCDSVVTLHLTVGHSNTGDTTAFACNSFDWYEHHNITSSTSSLKHTFTNASGCDSVVTLHLTVGHSNTGDTTAFACNSFDWYEHHNITSSTSSLKHTFTNASGCDSVVTLHLTVGHSNTGDTTAFACNSFDWYEHHNITSSTNSLTHTFTNASGCDSVVTLHLTVGHSNTGDTTAFACNSFDWYEHHNITSSTSSLKHTFTNASGCDSVVTLHLTINQPTTGDTNAVACGSFDWYEHKNITANTSSLTHTFTNANGCDSVVTLHLVINNAVNTDTTAEAVETFVWHRAGAADTTITTSGTYTYTHPDANGCVQTDTLHLTVYHATGTQIDTAACESFVWHRPIAGDTTINDSGTYVDNLTDVHGADSVITLVLNIKHGNFIPFSVAECDSYSWHDSTYTENGTYIFEYVNNVGCPSTDTLHLTINHAVNTDTTAEAVETFVWHRAGAADTTITTSGTYTHAHPDANGCTQTDTLHLTVYHATGTQIDTAACESFVWQRPIAGDTTINDSGTYVDNLTDMHGADSVITLVLNIKHGNFIPFSVAECISYMWHDTTYTESGNYLFEYINNVGCPSTDTLHLTINHAVNTDTTAEAVEAFVWHRAGAADTTITTSGTYTHAHPDANGCTQTDTLHLTVYHASGTQIDTAACESFVWHRPLAGDTILTNSGTYIDNLTDVHGADSVVTLVLTIYSAEHTDLHVSICENELPYHYINGQIDTTFDVGTPSLLTVTYTLSTVNGCDSTVSLNITLFEVVNTDTVAEAVEAFIWHRAGAADTTITTSGTYTHTHPDDNGCTQTDTLHLTVYHATNTQIDTSACEEFLWHRPLAGDTILTNSGTYIDNLTDVHGADSVVTLVLTIYSTEHTDLNEYICQNELPYHYINGQIDTTFEVGTPSLLTVTYTLPTANGCDSTVTLNITLLEVVNTVAEAEAVEAFVWHRAGAADTTITSSGTYTHTHPDNNGCTQTDTLHLTIYHATNTQIDTSACEEFLWHRPLAGDTIITNSGTYIDNFTDVHGADSVVTLVLTIYSTEHTDLHVSICENELPYHYISGQIDTTFEVGTPSLVTVPYTLSTANGCDSIVTLNLTVNPTYAIDTAVTITTNDLPYHFVSGQIDTTFEVGSPSLLTVPYTLSTVDGCDSTVTLHLTINVGIENHTAELLRAFPNPTTGHVTVIGSEEFTQLQLFDAYGRRVGIYPVEGTQTEIDLHGLASGVYFLKAMREKQTAGTLKIIKSKE